MYCRLSEFDLCFGAGKCADLAVFENSKGPGMGATGVCGGAPLKKH